MTDLTFSRSDANRELRYLARFAVVGAGGAVLDFTVLNLLIFGLGWDGPLQLLLANTISTSAAIISNFIWNRRWTFGAHDNNLAGRQFGQFVAVSCVGLVINTIAFSIINSYLLSSAIAPALSVQLAKAFAIAITMFWNFAANRIWTFGSN